MKRRQFIAAAGLGGALAGAGCLGTVFSDPDPVFPMQKFVEALDESQSPPHRVTVLSRWEKEEGGFTYGSNEDTPLGDTGIDRSWLDVPTDGEPLVVDGALHAQLEAQFDELGYHAHVCWPDENGDGSWACRGYPLSRADFNAFTLSDAIVLEHSDGTTPHDGRGTQASVEDVDEGEGLLAERM